MRRTALGIAFSIAIVGVGSSAAYAASCNDPADKAAFHVRSLQTELMVAALTCGARSDYNDFAVKFRDSLIDQGRALKRSFRASLGSGADRELNAYITALANRASQRSIASRDKYCARAARTFAALSQMNAVELAAFSMQRPAGDVDVPSSCRPDVVLVDKTQ